MKRSHPILPLTACFQAFLLVLLVAGGSALHAQNTSPLDTAPGVASNSNTSPDDAASLVANGDFELAAGDPTWPDGGWVKAKGITWETENGKHFLHLVQQKPGTMLMAYNEIPVPEGIKKLKITIRYRTAGVVVGTQNWFDARAIFHFIDAARKQISPDPGALLFSKNADDWTIASEEIAVPDGAVKMMLIPCLFQVESGTLDLAEISVTPVSP